MSVTERDRRHVFAKLEEAIGLEAANSLMELLPFHPTIELVTRADMAATSSVLRGEMSELRADLQSEMSELRADLQGEMSELRGEMVALRGELKGKFYRWGAVVVGANTVAMITALIT
jgi:hypothetical protein